MNKILLCIAFILLSYLNLHAQKVYDFQLAPSKIKVTNSLYNSLTILDQRYDTTSFGFIRVGFADTYKRVVCATPISAQFKALFNSVIDSTAANGKLLLQITRLLFAERQNEFTDNAYFNMRANLYAQIDGHYQMLATIDTLVVKTSLGPYKEILKSANEIMSDFITENLKVKYSGGAYIYTYTYYDILHISDLEKSNITLYNTIDYTDGLYLTYKSFRNQMPDRQIIVDSADNLNAGSIRTIEGGGVTKKVKAENVYAIVYRGHPYVVSEGIYYPLNKVKNDFYFVGKAPFYIIPGAELVADIAGGTPHGFILNFPTATYQMEIDYKNGIFLRLKKIDNAKAKPVEQKNN